MLGDAHRAESTRYGWMREPCAKANRASVLEVSGLRDGREGCPPPPFAHKADAATERDDSRGLREGQTGKPSSVSCLRDGRDGYPPSRHRDIARAEVAYA